MPINISLERSLKLCKLVTISYQFIKNFYHFSSIPPPLVSTCHREVIMLKVTSSGLLKVPFPIDTHRVNLFRQTIHLCAFQGGKYYNETKTNERSREKKWCHGKTSRVSFFVALPFSSLRPKLKAQMKARFPAQSAGFRQMFVSMCVFGDGMKLSVDFCSFHLFSSTIH